MRDEIVQRGQRQQRTVISPEVNTEAQQPAVLRLPRDLLVARSAPNASSSVWSDSVAWPMTSTSEPSLELERLHGYPLLVVAEPLQIGGNAPRPLGS